MYNAHFGFNAAPFAITPDPHYLYLSERHQEALAHLLYGVKEGSGFVLLTGEVGTGKTTLCRCLIDQAPENVDVALLLNPRLSSLELLATLFDELRLHYDSSFSLKNFVDTLNTYLLTSYGIGRRTVLILDEAQNLSTEVLEQVRLLTNLETNRQKLLQIILVGQPELKTLLNRTNLRQLAQRITARYHLLPLSKKDTQGYIEHRLEVSGVRHKVFENRCMGRIYRETGGIPRLINIICDRALLGGYVKNVQLITKAMVGKAITEVRGERSFYFPLHWLAAALAIIFIFGTSFIFLSSLESPQRLALEEDDRRVFALSLPPKGGLQTVNDYVPEVRALTEEEANDIPEVHAHLRTILSTNNLATDITSAFEFLFQEWGVNYQKLMGESACQRAINIELACLHKIGTWDDIRRYNRPVIIELVNEAGKQHHAVVTHLDSEKAWLNFGEQTFLVPLARINEYWLGQFLLLWRPPEIPVRVLNRGDEGEAVIWLRKHLDQATQRSLEPSPSPRFDKALRERIKEFQASQQLTVDGLAGEQTLLLLQAVATDQPSLR